MPDRIKRYIDAVPQMEINDGLVHLQQPDGTDKRVMPLSVFRATHRRMGAVLAVFDAKGSDVISMDAGKK